jgi:hypothetical protein
MNNEALVVGISSFVGVAVYLYLGILMARRPVSVEARLPALQFAIFWFGLAGASVLGGILSLTAAWVVPSLPVVLSFLYFDILVISAALWGLISYLIFLYSGRNRVLPITLLYIVEYGLLVYYITASQANGVTVTAGSVDPTYSMMPTGLVVIVPVLLLVIPELVASVAYLTLFFRTHDRTVRYRVLLVSLGILAWFLLDFLNIGSAPGSGLALLAVGRLLEILAALVVLAAYYPPRWIRDRFQVAGIGGATAGR